MSNTKNNSLASLLLMIITVQLGFTHTDLDLRGSGVFPIFILEWALFLMYLFIRKYNLKVLLTICAFMGISLVTYLVSNSKDFMYLLMIAIIAEQMDFHYLFKVIYKTKLAVLLFVVTLSILGILNIYERDITKLNGVVVTGYGLGYSHPNRLGFVILSVVLSKIALLKNKIRFGDYFFCIVLCILGCIVTKSRTLLLMSCLALLLSWYVNSHQHNLKTNKRFRNILLCVFPACAIISIVFPLILAYGNGKVYDIVYSLDSMMNLRFTHIRRTLLTYPVTMFGGMHSFDLLEELYHYSTVDNGFIRLIYSFGVIGFLVFLVFTVASTYYLYKKEEFLYASIIIVMSLWGLSENILVCFAFNVFPVFWCLLIRQAEEKEDNKKSSKSSA